MSRVVALALLLAGCGIFGDGDGDGQRKQTTITGVHVTTNGKCNVVVLIFGEDTTITGTPGEDIPLPDGRTLTFTPNCSSATTITEEGETETLKARRVL